MSNYEKMRDSAALLFLRHDQEEMIRKFDLEHDERFLYVTFAGKKYRVDRTAGTIDRLDGSLQPEGKADYNEAMTIYDVLCYSKPDCRLAHEWANVESLSAVQGGTLAKGGNFFQNAGEFFDGKVSLLARACEALHGRKADGGDAAYELDLFPFLPVFLRFWQSDEDFPASLQILTDRNILDYMHYETLMFALSHLLHVLKIECEKTLSQE